MIFEWIGSLLLRPWYQLTAYVPRRLPETAEEYQRFTRILFRYYDCPTGPQERILISSLVCSTAAHRLRRPWGHIANHVKRIEINNLAKDFGDISRGLLRQRLEEATAKQVKYLDSVKKTLSENPDEATAILSNLPGAGEALATRLEEEHPGVAPAEEWLPYIKSVALQENVNRVNKDSQVQPVPNAQPAPPTP